VAEEGTPMRHEDFPRDDKPTKLKARVMMQMTQDLNDKYLTQLANRAEPPVRVQCVTCHHGASVPRTLQQVVRTAYDRGGVDSATVQYRTLRDRNYGRAVYDFGEVPLVDVANDIRQAGHDADAAQLLALNLEMNPNSTYAQRQYVRAALAQSFRDAGPDSGQATYRALMSRFGPTVVIEDIVNLAAYDLLGADHTAPALALFRLNVAEHPKSANAYDGLGEAYLKSGDRKRAIEAYTQVLALEPDNENARHQLEDLKASPKKSTGKKK
jgi:tetratricopeptide (TPR) repeat protein